MSTGGTDQLLLLSKELFPGHDKPLNREAGWWHHGQLVCLVLPHLHCVVVGLVVPHSVLLSHQMGRAGGFFCGGPGHTEIGPMLRR